MEESLMTLKLIGADILRHRALYNARGPAGVLALIGTETRVQRELVEEGHLLQEIAEGGRYYRFTLSPSGRRLLDKAEGL
jgi:hypothetical protein